MVVENKKWEWLQTNVLVERVSSTSGEKKYKLRFIREHPDQIAFWEVYD